MNTNACIRIMKVGIATVMVSIGCRSKNSSSPGITKKNDAGIAHRISNLISHTLHAIANVTFAFLSLVPCDDGLVLFSLGRMGL